VWFAALRRSQKVVSEEEIAFTLTEMAANDRFGSIALVFLISFPFVQCRQQ